MVEPWALGEIARELVRHDDEREATLSRRRTLVHRALADLRAALEVLVLRGPFAS